MSGRHSQPDEPRAHARRATLLAGAGVAGLVSAIAAAPLLDAGPAGAAAAGAVSTAATVSTVATETDGQPLPVTTTTTSESETSEPATSESETSEPETSELETSEPGTTTAPETSEPETGTTTTEVPTSEPISSASSPVAPDFGFQKYRVGVRPDAGSYVPSGVTTAGSTLHVTETDSDGTTVDQFDCTTTTDVTPDGTTYCDPSARVVDRVPQRRTESRTRAGGLRPAVVTGPPSSLGDNSDVYFATTEGSTITVAQTSAPDALVADPETAELPPCEAAFFGDECNQTDVVFEDTGLPPKAEDDTATTATNTPVTIDVGANDERYHGSTAKYDAPVTDETIAADPAHGTVQVAPLQGGEAEAGRALAAAVPAQPKITYTPRSGFAGVDKFRYTLHTRNGVSSATVTVTIAGGATSTPSRPATPVAPDTPVSASTSFGFDPSSSSRVPDPITTTTSSPLATTGADGTPLLGYGLAMIGAGAGAVVVGRHRRGRSRRAH